MKSEKKSIVGLLAFTVIVCLMSGCASGPKAVKLDPKNPTTVTVWHYYNGAVINAFDQLVKEFNETVGIEKGIIVQGSGMGNVSELRGAVLASANNEVGSQPIPDIFAAYADTAYAAEQLGILADMNAYFTKEELDEYIASYVDEGRIGINGELRIFPIAKSTEIFMLNETDWAPFAVEKGFTHDDLKTVEGLAAVAGAYYEWTDAKTPDVPNDGKAFWGRDAMANMFIIGSKQLGTEIFTVDKGKATINADETIMRRIWDNYYLPYVNGHFLSAGRYRSDDTKVGELISYVGSTSSAMYFPSEVTIDGESRVIAATILPPPVYIGASDVLVQQGAGMVMSKSTPEKELASSIFLKWFTDTEVNIKFSALSGYMPVKKAANDYDKFMEVVNKNEIMQDEISMHTLEVAFDAVNKSEMYTSKTFAGAVEARSLLENSLQEKAVADRASVVEARENAAQVLATLSADENFDAWYQSFSEALQGCISAE